MKTSITHRKQTASFRIVGSTLTIAPLWLMLAAANTSAYAQTSDDISNSSATTATASSPADWTEFHRDNMQRWNPYETALGVGNAGSLQLRWKNPVGTYTQSIVSSPAVANGMVYFGSEDGHVYALNVSTGAQLWSYSTLFGVFSSPAVANGMLYFGLPDGTLYSLNANTGAKLWSYTAGDAVNSSPAVVNGVVYFGSVDGNMYALNASTGGKLWSFSTGSQVISSPAVVNGVVYFLRDVKVYALNANTGAMLWSFTTGPQNEGSPGIGSSPAVANGVVYVGSGDHNVYALNANTGAKLWSYTTGGIVGSSPAVANGVVYVHSIDGKVYALNANTGALLWSYAAGGQPWYSSPAVANGVVYIGSEGGYVYALNASTGAKLWSYVIGNVCSSPTIANGVVYIRGGNPNPSGAGNIYAFALGSADLFLRVQPSRTTVHQGDLLTFAFPVWNLGPANAAFEVLNTQVPAGTTFDYLRISGTAGLGTCTHPPYQGTGNIVCHENSTMAPNTTWTVRFTVKVTAPAGAVITESAATMATTPDPNTANNMATVSIKVQ